MGKILSKSEMMTWGALVLLTQNDPKGSSFKINFNTNNKPVVQIPYQTFGQLHQGQCKCNVGDLLLFLQVRKSMKNKIHKLKQKKHIQ